MFVADVPELIWIFPSFVAVPLPIDKLPVLSILICSPAAALAPVLNTRDVALELELKSPSDTASIPAATNIAVSYTHLTLPTTD